MASWAIYLRDADRKLIAEVDDFQRLDLTLKFNGVSAFTIDMPVGNEVSNACSFASGVVITRDGRTILSGPITRLSRTWNDAQNTLRVSGPSDAVWLDRRLASPVPSGPPYTSASHDVRTGFASNVITDYVRYNAGDHATAARRVAGLTIESSVGLGTVVTGRARFDNLLELIKGLALAGGDIGFNVIQSGGNIVFSTYQPIDRSASVVFSPELGNLTAFEYEAEASSANFILCAGGGELTARLFVEDDDDASVAKYGRIEMFRDRRDTTDTNEMVQTIQEELATRAEITSLSITPIDNGTANYLTHYQLGDVVTVVVDDVPTSGAVREVRLSLTPDGERITPVIGTPGGTSILRLFDDVARANSRVNDLERRV